MRLSNQIFRDGLQTSELAVILFMSPVLALLLQVECARSVVSLPCK